MEGFISALRMFEGSSNIQYWRGSARHRLSWPLASALAWAENSEDFRRIISAAEEGALGTVEIWIECQGKWVELQAGEYISILEMEINSELPWTLDSIASSAPTILGFGWRSIHSLGTDSQGALALMKKGRRSCVELPGQK